MTALTVLFAHVSLKLRKQKVLIAALAVLMLALYIALFIVWGIYTSTKFEGAGLFLKYLPVGVPFFVLQGMRFVFDMSFRKIPENTSVGSITEYLLFYPRLVMGPVQSFSEHSEMLLNSRLDSETLGEGLCLFVKGLAKKVLLADMIGILFESEYVMNSGTSIIMSWLTTAAFALQFYFTVSGYGNMARGLGLCYGLKMCQSYGKPLICGSMETFDSQWNISVVSWFKGCFSVLAKMKGVLPFAGIILAWTLTGVWYRPELHLLIWGAWMGLWIAADRLLRKSIPKIPSVVYGVAFAVIMLVGWSFFMADSVADGLRRITLLLGSGGKLFSEKDLYFIQSGWLILTISIYSATDNFGKLTDKMKNVPVLSKAVSVLTLPVVLALLVLCIAMLATNMDILALSRKGVM